jgi:mRNA interferase MazF
MSGSKVRPALVVQCDANNQRLQDVIVAVITRTTKLATVTPTQLLIDIATPDGKSAGLLHTSAVKCEHLITIEQNLIQRKIGSLPVQLMRQVDDCLKASLQLP